MNKTKLVKNAFILLSGCVFIYPILLILTNSFKPYVSIIDNFFGLPQEISLRKYIETWTDMSFGLLFFNTAVYTVIIVAITVFTASMAGYMMARTNTGFSKILLLIFMIPLMLPFQSFMITMTKLAKTTGMMGNRTGYIVILSGLFIPLATFLISRFVSTIPIQIEECARIDGASTFIIFLKIIFPLLNPAVVTVIVIDTISVWNDFLVQVLIIGGKRNLFNLQNALYAEFSSQATDWEHALPGLMISLLPVLIFFIIMQRQIVDGITSGSVKG